MHLDAQPRAQPKTSSPVRVFVIGATGTIGQATIRALLRRGHEVVCFVRPRAGGKGKLLPADSDALFPGATVRMGDVCDAVSLANDGFCGERFDALVSCLASRTGTPKDAWAIDHDAHLLALAAAKFAGVTQVVLLSAICVQKPLLAFQQAKLAFEKVVVESGLTYSIVRATAFFKSLSGRERAVAKDQKRLTSLHPLDLARQRLKKRRRPDDGISQARFNHHFFEGQLGLLKSQQRLLHTNRRKQHYLRHSSKFGSS